MAGQATFPLYRGPYDGGEIESHLTDGVNEVALAFVPRGDIVGQVIKLDPKTDAGMIVRYARYRWIETNVNGYPAREGDTITLRLIFVGFL